MSEVRTFDEALRDVCKSYEGRRFTQRLAAEFRARVEHLVRLQYASGSFLLDAQDREPIPAIEDVHIAIGYDEARHNLGLTIVRKRGRAH